LDGHIAQVRVDLEKLWAGLRAFVKGSAELQAKLEACLLLQFEKKKRLDQRAYQQNKRAERNQQLQQQREEDAEERSRMSRFNAHSLGGDLEDLRDSIEEENVLWDMYNQDPNESDEEDDESDSL